MNRADDTKIAKPRNAPRFLILGSGRLARHLRHYFQILNIPTSEWDRSQDPHLIATHVNSATHVLLAVSDSAIESVYRKFVDGHDKVVVHFSGALHIPGLIAAHPLMTFGSELYEASLYRKIHFVLTGADSLDQALPGLPNNYSLLPATDKAYYHAMCVVGGNFSTLLFQKMQSEFVRLGLPPEAAHPYLEKTLENALSQAVALTGPLARRDRSTVEQNLGSLNGDNFKPIYEAFTRLQWPDFFSEGITK